jgi:tetratricopeptide (TPR) repeat protein
MFLAPPALAVALFAIYLAQIQSQPFFKYLVANPVVYDGEARQLVAGAPSGHPFFLSALYPAFVALVYGLSGGSRLVLAVVQGALMAASVWLAGQIARRLLSPWAALGASLGMAFYWSFYYFAGEIVPATLFVTLMLAGTLLFLERDRRPSPLCFAGVAVTLVASVMYAGPGVRHIGDLVGGKALPQPAGAYWAGLAFFGLLTAGGLACLVVPRCRQRFAGTDNLAAGGFTLGAATLAWSGSLALAAVYVVGLALKKGRRAGAVVLAAGFVLPILASLVHNGIVSGDFIPVTSSFGVNLFIGNNPASDGMDPFHLGEGNQVRIEADRLWLSGKQRSDFYAGKAFEFISKQPGRWLGLEGRKLLIWLSSVQVNNNADIAERRSAWKSLFLPVLGFGIVFPLACAGVVGAVLRNRKALWLAAGYLSFLAVPLVFFACERFRLPATVLLVMLAALGAETLICLVRAPRGTALALMVTALAAGAVVSNVDFLRIRGREMPSIVSNKAYVERLAGNTQKARQLADHALALDPADAGALCQLGALEEQAGNKIEAAGYYLDCLESDPFFYAAYQGAARMLTAEGINASYLDAYVDDLVRGVRGHKRADLLGFLKRRSP